MKEIQLSKQGKHKGKYVALVDDEDFERVNQFNWYAHITNYTVYAARNTSVDENGKVIMMHQFILNYIKIDHKDFNGLNNQKHNIRPCTHAENMRNRKPFKNIKSSSKYKGISFNKTKGKWVSLIWHNNKVIYLGQFEEEINAAKAYNKKAIELFGEFAFLNMVS
jgi:AP2-like factor (euAP2 lineage)